MAGITPFDCEPSDFAPILQSMAVITRAESRNFAIGCATALCTIFSAFGQQAPSQPQTPITPQITPKDFTEQKLAVWQQRLKLEDWKISVALVRLNDLPPKTLGGIRWDKGKKTATVWLLDPADYQLPYREMLDDMELTIVHELVHLDLASLPRGQASRSSEERAVNGIAQAMLGLDRKKD
jgi:hypothetical protein